MVELLKELIDDYMDSNRNIAEDLRQFSEKLMKSDESGRKPPIVVLTHELDINSLKASTNDKTLEYLLENEELFSRFFEKRLKRKLETNGKKIWFFIKYKNLPQNRNVKNSEQIGDKDVFSIDCLQIVSFSERTDHQIGRKYVSEADQSEKWRLKKVREKGFPKLSDNYREVKKKRVFTKKRLFVAKIGSQERTTSLEISVFMETLDEREVQCLYNGSHLNSVVLLQTDSEYVLLSLEKMWSLSPPLITEFNQYLLQFPEEFRGLYEDRRKVNSNYSLALSLAFVFGDNISISGSFFRLKLGLILSILSLKEYPKKNHSSVLVICDDTLMVRRLFEWSSLLAKHRLMQKSLSMPMTGRLRKQRLSSDNWIDWTDAGALQLGADGITIIGSVTNLNELPERERMALFHALDANEVIARQSQPSEPSLPELELKTTIWAMIEDDIEERQYRKPNRSQTILWTQVFGMVYRIPQTKTNYLFTRTGYEGTLSLEDWKTIIELMAQNSPRMSRTAESLLQDYYVANRCIRGSKLNHISFQTLVSLSKSMAKLCLRLTVTKYDALMAILLYEESLITRLCENESFLSVNPIFHVSVEQMEEYIGFKADHTMEVFENSLMEFIEKQKKSPNFKQSLSQIEE